MMVTQTEPPAFRESALDALENLRTAIDSGNVEETVDRLRALRGIVKDWQRAAVIKDTKTWIDDMLKADLLTFNAEEARQKLAKWRQIAPDGEDHEVRRYEGIVEDRAKRKQTALMVQGVTTHCDTLLARVAELERSETPPRPDFLLSNYYEKAHAIVRAAAAEEDDSAELTMLLQRVEKLHNDKQIAARIYTPAFEDEQYSTALRDLTRLPSDMLIPRYTTGDDLITSGKVYLSFAGMVSAAEARRELQTLAQKWAAAQAANLTRNVTEQLDAHEPQAALDLLADRNRLEEFLNADTRAQLDTLQSHARTDLANRQRCETLANQAMQTIDANPTDAWNIYVDAYRLFQWSPELPPLREAIVKALVVQLERLVSRANQAFDNREMEHVRQIAGNARRIYSEKDRALDSLLERMISLEEMTQQYEEYLSSASDLYTQVKVLLRDDAVAANDLLTQLESYPDIVLASFPDLHEYRSRVNRRLNADHLFNQLYPQLFVPEINLVEQAVNTALNAVENYQDDARFPAMANNLTLHRDFLLAKEQRSAGHLERAIFLLEPIATSVSHPDQEAARQLLRELQPPPLASQS